MSGEARISEREAVMRERAAFIVGACDTTFATRDGARDDAERRYKLPKVERQRVVADPVQNGYVWMFDNNILWFSTDRHEWTAVDSTHARSHPVARVSVLRVEMWASLLANPTELVDEPDPGVSS